MARSKRKSPAEELAEGIGRALPWWACVTLGLVSYFVLHAYAGRPLAPVNATNQLNGAIRESMLHGLAAVGQYVLPLLFAAAAMVSLVVRRDRTQLVERATGSDAAGAVSAMTWQQFEVLIGEAFRLQGYRVTEQGGGGADGGVDLSLRRGSETFLVQAKHWKAFKVGVDIVRSLYGVMAAQGAAGGFVITSGQFTPEATAFAKGRNVELVDGPKLLRLLEQAKADAGGKASASREPPRSAPTTEAAIPTKAVDGASPQCPVCSRPMQLKTARRGSNAGNAFWGCPAFSSGCRGTRPA